MILELAEDGEAELFVEGASLEVEGVEPDAGEITGAGDLLGLPHEVCAEAMAAEGFGDEEELDEEPFVAGEAGETADDGTLRVFDEKGERMMVCRWALAAL